MHRNFESRHHLCVIMFLCSRTVLFHFWLGFSMKNIVYKIDAPQLELFLICVWQKCELPVCLVSSVDITGISINSSRLFEFAPKDLPFPFHHYSKFKHCHQCGHLALSIWAQLTGPSAQSVKQFRSHLSCVVCMSSEATYYSVTKQVVIWTLCDDIWPKRFDRKKGYVCSSYSTLSNDVTWSVGIVYPAFKENSRMHN